MTTSKKTRQNAKKTSVQNAFIWTDDKVELLLTVTNEYNLSTKYESVDWESPFKANMRTYSSDYSRRGSEG